MGVGVGVGVGVGLGVAEAEAALADDGEVDEVPVAMRSTRRDIVENVAKNNSKTITAGTSAVGREREEANRGASYFSGAPRLPASRRVFGEPPAAARVPCARSWLGADTRINIVHAHEREGGRSIPRSQEAIRAAPPADGKVVISVG